MHEFQIPGLIIEPLLFATIIYWLAGLRDNVETFGFTLLVLLLTINVSTACGKAIYLYDKTKSWTKRESKGRIKRY